MGRRLKTAAIVVAGATLAIAFAFGAFIAWGDGPQGGRALERGDYAEALRHYDAALDSRYLTQDYRASLLVSRGITKMELQQIENAVADYSAAIALRPNYDAALSMRSRAYSISGQFDKSIEDLSDAIRILPNNATLFLWRAQVYDSTLAVDEAIADYATVVRMAPQSADAYFRQAYNLARKGKIADAAEVIAKTPMVNAYDAESHVRRGDEFDMVGASERALTSYAQAIRIEPNSSRAYRERGVAYVTVGEYETAMADFARAIEINPSDDIAYYQRGRGEYLRGDYRAARNDLKRAVELQPDNDYPPLWLHLAQVRLGDAALDDLADRATGTDRKFWPQPIVEFYLAQRDEASLHAAALDDIRPSTAADRLCEAEYYIGALRLAEGKIAAALPFLRRAADSCPPGFVELISARADLKRLGK